MSETERGTAFERPEISSEEIATTEEGSSVADPKPYQPESKIIVSQKLPDRAKILDTVVLGFSLAPFRLRG